MQLTFGKIASYYYIDNLVDLKEAICHFKNRINPDKVIACDTETRVLYDEYGSAASWRDPHTSRVSLLQYYIEDDEYPFIIDVLKLGVENTRELIETLDTSGMLILFLNAKYDLKVIYSTWGIWLKNVWCVMVMSQRLGVCTGFRASQMRGHSYRAIARDYFGIDISKTEQSSNWSNPNRTIEQLDYAAVDVFAPIGSSIKSILIAAYRLFHNVLYTPSPKGFGGHCKLKDYKEPIEVDQAANAILAEIEYTGMPVSKKMLDLIYNTASKELEELKLYLCKSFSLPLRQTIEYTEQGAQLKVIVSEKVEKTLNSPQQLVQLVNKVLRSQGIVIDNVKSESLEAVLKRLKVVDLEEESEDDYEEDYYKDEEEEDDSQHDASWGIELIDKLVKYKELAKLVSIDYRKLINPVTGRVHSSYQAIGASTGRMSSGGKGSFNAQNISTKHLFVKYYLNYNPYTDKFKVDQDKEILQDVTLRHAFVIDKLGYIFASADFSAQELRVAAALSKDPNMGKVYKLEKEYIEGVRPKPKHPETNEEYDDPQVDLHIMAATSLDPEVKRLVKEEPWNALASNPVVAPVRKKAKPLSYGLIYLAQAPTIAGQINSTKEEAQQAIDKYFSYPDGFYGLHEWLESTAMIGTELRWIRLITGELVMTSESNSKGLSDNNSTARKSCNGSIQGVSSTQSKLALIKAHRKFKELDKKYELILEGRKAELIAIVHDEIDAICPGDCFFELVPDSKLNEKHNTDCYYKPKTTFNNELVEHKIAMEYSNALKECMQEAMKETFDIIGSEVPALSSVASSLFWVH